MAARRYQRQHRGGKRGGSVATAAVAAAARRQRGDGVGEQGVGSVVAAGMAVAAAATRDLSVAAEGCVPMTPGGQGPRTGVGQGPCATEVKRHRLSPARSRSGGMRDESERGEEEDRFTTAAAMLLRGGMRWGDCKGKEEEVEEDDKGMTVAALGGVGSQNESGNTTRESGLWTIFLASPDLEQLLTKTKKELRQAPSDVTRQQFNQINPVRNRGIIANLCHIYSRCVTYEIKMYFCAPQKTTKEYPAPTPNRDPSFNHSEYTRLPQESAQLFRPCVSSEFDI